MSIHIDTANPRVRQEGKDYEVLVNGRWYLVEEDDRPRPPVWRAYTDPRSTDGGEWIGQTFDPLSGNTKACAEYSTAAELIDILLAAGGAA
jgi:hypothetical protein